MKAVAQISLRGQVHCPICTHTVPADVDMERASRDRSQLEHYAVASPHVLAEPAFGSGDGWGWARWVVGLKNSFASLVSSQ